MQCKRSLNDLTGRGEKRCHLVILSTKLNEVSDQSASYFTNVCSALQTNQSTVPILLPSERAFNVQSILNFVQFMVDHKCAHSTYLGVQAAIMKC